MGSVLPNAMSSSAIGTMDARMTPAMTPIGKSRSVISRPMFPADRRVRLAARADRIPLTIGPRIRSRVQSAATPMVPAPMKRTFSRKTVPTNVSTSVAGTPACAVSHGTRTNQLMIMPTAIATPTAIPTRWPTPIRAIDRLVDIVVAPPAKPKVLAASAARMRVWAMAA